RPARLSPRSATARLVAASDRGSVHVGLGRWPSGPQEDPKACPTAVSLLTPRPPLVELREASNQGQPDPHPGGVLERLAALPERLEDDRPQFRGNSRTRVLDGDQHALWVRIDRNPDGGAPRRVADGIHDQVLDDTLDVGRVDRRHYRDPRHELDRMR